MFYQNLKTILGRFGAVYPHSGWITKTYWPEIGYTPEEITKLYEHKVVARDEDDNI